MIRTSCCLNCSWLQSYYSNCTCCSVVYSFLVPRLHLEVHQQNFIHHLRQLSQTLCHLFPSIHFTSKMYYFFHPCHILEASMDLVNLKSFSLYHVLELSSFSSCVLFVGWFHPWLNWDVKRRMCWDLHQPQLIQLNLIDTMVAVQNSSVYENGHSDSQFRTTLWNVRKQDDSRVKLTLDFVDY